MRGRPAGGGRPRFPRALRLRAAAPSRRWRHAGYLQLTAALNNRAGSVLYNRPIPATAGISMALRQFQYGGTGADGIGFFLVDGATNLTATGANGGSLGYAQKDGNPARDPGRLRRRRLRRVRQLLQRRRVPRHRLPGRSAVADDELGPIAPNVVTVRGPGAG